jgi:hypothetical protein
MRTVGIVLGALTLTLGACGDDDTTGDTQDAATAAEGRDDFCPALDQVDDAAVAGDEDATRSGFQATFDVVEWKTQAMSSSAPYSTICEMPRVVQTSPTRWSTRPITASRPSPLRTSVLAWRGFYETSAAAATGTRTRCKASPSTALSVPTASRPATRRSRRATS